MRVSGFVVVTVLTAQAPLPMAMITGATPVGLAAELVMDEAGGRVFVHGNLVYCWAAGDEVLRRMCAVHLVELGIAGAGEVACGFAIGSATLWRWRRQFAGTGVVGLVPDKRGPKGPSKLTGAVVDQIVVLRAQGGSLRAIGMAVGVTADTVARALAGAETLDPVVGAGPVPASEPEPGVVLPVLAEPVPRTSERVAARAGLLECAVPVFTPASRVPLAGLLLAMPGLAATGLLTCANEVYTKLADGFYGLDTMLIEVVLRALAGEPRAEGATRFDPAALGRVLGLDRAPEVKTIRRKIAELAATGKASDLQAAMAARHLARVRTQSDTDGGTPIVLYVDGHVRAYQGTRRVAKTHLSRLRFPAPATIETWVCDGGGDPVLVVMSEPGASLAGELRRLLPELRTAIGDQRRVLVGFDRGGWSPALFAHLDGAGFDTLTWRKGPADDVDPDLFTEHVFTDPTTGLTRTSTLADTTVDLPTSDQGETFRMRQVTVLDTTKPVARQVHILTTRTDWGPGEVIHKMGARWRIENYFRYARTHLALDAHECYASTDDDPNRLVPNPAKKTSRATVAAARARVERAAARTDTALLTARTPPTPGAGPQHEVLITNAEHNAMTAGLRAAETDLAAAITAHHQVPVRVRLGDLHPGQQVLDVETKLLAHTIHMAAFNTTTALARDIRMLTGYARAAEEAFTLARQVLTQPGDIDPTIDGVLTVRLDPMPTTRATTAIRELCDHLTATATTYPGTNRTLRYEIKDRP